MRTFGVRTKLKGELWVGKILTYAASNEILASKIKYGSQKH